jgi:SAM-dependent methyltransferase
VTRVEASDWYHHPLYYDIVFDEGTRKEADFLESVLARYGRGKVQNGAAILEPASGSGRLVIEMARRGHLSDGFDISTPMLRYSRMQARDLPAGTRDRVNFRRSRMQTFRAPPEHYDLIHCLLSTFKYLLTEKEAVAHLKRAAKALKIGGLYVLGIHLANYRRPSRDHERWIGERDGIRVTCDTTTWPADSSTRIEKLSNRLRIKRRGIRAVEKVETEWTCRTYDASELRRLIECVPAFEIAGCHDFAHRIACTRLLDDSQEDIVVVLRKAVTS